MVKLKKCFKCGEIKPISAFYKHNRMADGHLGKCKFCTRKDTKMRTDVLLQDESWHEKEKERQREKYYRLGYKEKHKPSTEQKRNTMQRYYNKYPEKQLAKSKTQCLKPKTKGNHLHHWSYNEEHYKDVIEINPAEHMKLHRYIIYDQERKMYRVAKTG